MSAKTDKGAATFDGLREVVDILNFEAKKLEELSGIVAAIYETGDAGIMGRHVSDMLSRTLSMSAERIERASDMVDRIPGEMATQQERRGPANAIPANGRPGARRPRAGEENR